MSSGTRFSEADLFRLQNVKKLQVNDPVMETKLKRAFGVPELKNFHGREDDFQKVLMGMLKAKYPNKLIIHVPNGGYRTKAEGGILKAMGVLAGVPDILDFDDRIFLELKVKPNTTSPKQLEVMAKFIAIGWKGKVVYGVEEALIFVEQNIIN